MNTIAITHPPHGKIVIPAEFSSWDAIYAFIMKHQDDLLQDDLAEFMPVSNDEIPVHVLQDIIQAKQTPLSQFSNL